MRYGNKLEQALVCIHHIEWAKQRIKEEPTEMLCIIGQMDWVAELWMIVLGE